MTFEGNSQLESIGDSAFESCTNLESINISSSVTSIREYAFLNCSNLSSIIIPDSVTSIEKYAFDGCASLTSITLNWTAEQLNESSLSIDSTWLFNHNVTKYTTVYIPEWTTEAYEKAINNGILNFDALGTYDPESEGDNWCFVDSVQPTPEPRPISHWGLGIGLAIGLGVPAVGGIGFGIYYGVKRKKNKK